MESGSLKLKCKDCGRFGDTDEYNEEGNNKIDEFAFICPSCQGDEYEYYAGDVDGEEGDSNIECKVCHKDIYEEDYARNCKMPDCDTVKGLNNNCLKQYG